MSSVFRKKMEIPHRTSHQPYLQANDSLTMVHAFSWREIHLFFQKHPETSIPDVSRDPSDRAFRRLTCLQLWILLYYSPRSRPASICPISRSKSHHSLTAYMAGPTRTKVRSKAFRLSFDAKKTVTERSRLRTPPDRTSKIDGSNGKSGDSN